MGDHEALRLDYEHTTELLWRLTEIRFKLLGLVPTVAAAAVGLLSRDSSSGELLAVGLVGLTATLGVLLYELRNGEIHDAELRRARELEARLGLPAIGGTAVTGGPFSERPSPGIRLFGGLDARHRSGLALVYAAALAGWAYLALWGSLLALGAPEAQTIAGALGVLAGVAVAYELRRNRRPE